MGEGMKAGSDGERARSRGESDGRGMAEAWEKVQRRKRGRGAVEKEMTEAWEERDGQVTGGERGARGMEEMAKAEEESAARGLGGKRARQRR